MGNRLELKLKHLAFFTLSCMQLISETTYKDVKHANPVTSVTLSQSNCAFVMFVCILSMYARDVCMYSFASGVNFSGTWKNEKNGKN